MAQPVKMRPRPSCRGDANWVAGVGCLVAMLCAAACLLTTAWSVNKAIQSNPLYGEALDRARANPEVVKRLGAPITAGFSIHGNINMQNDLTGSADVTIPIRGPKGKASLHFSGSASDDRTNITALEVIFPDGMKVDLRTQEERKSSPPIESTVESTDDSAIEI